MDEYSRTADRLRKAMVIQREKEKVARMRELLKAQTEEQFRAILEKDWQVGPEHPNYKVMLQMWRSQH